MNYVRAVCCNPPSYLNREMASADLMRNSIAIAAVSSSVEAVNSLSIAITIASLMIICILYKGLWEALVGIWGFKSLMDSLA